MKRREGSRHEPRVEVAVQNVPCFLLVTLLVMALPLFAGGRDIAEPGFGPAAGFTPMTASNGSNFLTVWGRGTMMEGSIANADGATITTIPFAIAAASDFTNARLVAVGENYYLIGRTPNGAIRTATISSTGLVTPDSPHLKVPATLTDPAIASSPDRILVADRTPSNVDVYANFLDGSGAFLSRTKIGAASSWSAAWNGSEFVLATHELTSIVLYRFTGDGASIDRRIVASASVSHITVVVAASADGSLVAWNELGSSIINVAVVRHGGNARLSTLTRDARVSSVAVTAVGSSYLLTENHLPGATVTQLSSDGVVIAGPVSIVAADSVASNGSIGYVVGARAAIRSTVVRPGNPLNVEQTAILSTAPRRQDAESIASNGIDFLALWRQSDSLNVDSYARKVDRHGVPRDPVVTISGDRESVSSSDLAFAASIYLATFLDSRLGLRAQRLTAGGELLGEPILIANFAYRSSMAAAGDRFYVIWTDGQYVTHGAFIGADGSVSQPALLAPNTRSAFAHRVAFNGKVVLVLLEFPSLSLINPFSPPPDIRALRVSLSGVRLDAAPVIVADNVYQASIASNGRDFLVASDNIDRSTLTPIAADETTLTIGEAKTFFAARSGLVQSDIAWDGGEYVVAWRNAALGLARADETGTVRDAKQADITSPLLRSLSLGTNTLGDVAVLLTEGPLDQQLNRARVYTERDFLTPLTIPAAPSALAVSGISSSRTVRWSYDGPPVARFLVQSVTSFTTFTKEVPADVRSVDVLGAPHHVRVIAVAESGLATSTTLDLTNDRRRTVRR